VTCALMATLAACATVRPDPQSIFFDDFQDENGGLYALNYEHFRQWKVVRGSVDLIGTPPFHDFLPPEFQLHVDLDGSTREGGRLESREEIVLRPGRYRLAFDLAGCPRPSVPNRVTVTLGGVYQEQFVLESFAPVRRHARVVVVRRATRARIAFDHAGGDDYGILLDNVLLERL
jgi:hypothetical protein